MTVTILHTPSEDPESNDPSPLQPITLHLIIIQRTPQRALILPIYPPDPALPLRRLSQRNIAAGAIQHQHLPSAFPYLSTYFFLPVKLIASDSDSCLLACFAHVLKVSSLPGETSGGTIDASKQTDRQTSLALELSVNEICG